MSRIIRSRIAGALAVLALWHGPLQAQSSVDPAALYQEHCAACHGADRLGATGPALIPEALVRVREQAAREVIVNGRVATQMPGFADKLAPDAVASLLKYIFTPLSRVPAWREAEINASRELNPSPPKADKPRFAADPLNLFVVVETGDHHVTILDGDRFEPIHRFKSRFALHGGPKFTPDGRYVFFASRDGWVTKFDLWTLTVLAEVRAGLNTRNIAISKDGKHIAVANYLPHTLVMLSTEDLSIERIFDVNDRAGTTSRVSAVYQNPVRDSFIVALKDVAELWEVATDPNAEPVFGAFVHSRQPGLEEGIPESAGGLFARRRIALSEPLDDFYFDPSYHNLLGASRDGNKAVVINLDVRKPIARVDLPGMPHLGSGIAWTYQGKPVMATPHLREGKLSVIELENWTVVKTLTTGGPGFFMRSHEKSRYAWADAMMGRTSKDTLYLIDKQKLEVARTLTPAPGKVAAHVEFDRYGRHALVSIWENDGALIVYDAETLQEVKRLTMSKPSGKYNVYNKITFSEGTSH
jgi:mono/diheme cytochrome c family protein/DNA-binding beta-propeller fold protein YncE